MAVARFKVSCALAHVKRMMKSGVETSSVLCLLTEMN